MPKNMIWIWEHTVEIRVQVYVLGELGQGVEATLFSQHLQFLSED